MNVKQLIETLQDCNPEAEVVTLAPEDGYYKSIGTREFHVVEADQHYKDNSWIYGSVIDARDDSTGKKKVPAVVLV